MSPDGSTKPSPEERLLKLIRAKPAAAVSAGVRQAVGLNPAVALAGSGTAAGTQPLRWPVLVGGGLVAVIILELIYLAIQMVRPLPLVATPPVPEIPVTAPMSEVPPVEVPSVAGSLTRPLFVSSLATLSGSAAPDAPKPTGPSETAKSLVTRLTLSGIVAGDPAQAIIEDTETKKTYFVTAGQPVAEGAVLDKVESNRVILDLNGEKITLSL